jgi:hypothetical protein
MSPLEAHHKPIRSTLAACLSLEGESFERDAAGVG